LAFFQLCSSSSSVAPSKPLRKAKIFWQRLYLVCYALEYPMINCHQIVSFAVDSENPLRPIAICHQVEGITDEIEWFSAK
jgi:hypothetical protein